MPTEPQDLVVEARELLRLVTPQPWKIESNGDVIGPDGVVILKTWNGYHNGELAARAPELLRLLADECERLQEQLRIYQNDPTAADTEYER